MNSLSQILQPSVQIGKNGLTPGLIEEIKKQLKIKKTIKIKFLKNFSEFEVIEDAAMIITEQTKTKLIQRIGRVIVISAQEN